METGTIVALMIAIPLVLFPAAFVWYINVSELLEARKRAKLRRKATQPDS
jgi:hypothetical protein